MRGIARDWLNNQPAYGTREGDIVFVKAFIFTSGIIVKTRLKCKVVRYDEGRTLVEFPAGDTGWFLPEQIEI